MPEDLLDSELEGEMAAKNTDIEFAKNLCKVIRKSGIIQEAAGVLGDARRELISVGFREQEIMKILEIVSKELGCD